MRVFIDQDWNRYMGKIIKSLSRLLVSLTRKNSQIWQVSLVISPLGLAHHYPLFQAPTIMIMALWDHGLSLELTAPPSHKEYIPKIVVLSLLKIKLKCLGHVKKVKIHSDNLLVLFSMFFVKHGELLRIFFSVFTFLIHLLSVILYTVFWWQIFGFEEIRTKFQKRILRLESL